MLYTVKMCALRHQNDFVLHHTIDRYESIFAFGSMIEHIVSHDIGSFRFPHMRVARVQSVHTGHSEYVPVRINHSKS